METFKEEKKPIQTQKPETRKKFIYLLDEDQTEVKKLSLEDVEDAAKVMLKCGFEVTEKEVADIVKIGMSFGTYVNRMLVGVGLGWPTTFNYEKRTLTGKELNALYMEDPAVLLSHEGRNIRRMLLHEREKEAVKNNLDYSIAYLYQDLPRGEISDYIRETGSQLEKLYLSEQYEFFRTDKGVLAVKKITQKS
ncbi:hypothetical protein HYT84_00025 [Candidatus Micrarchaeota archaeon]|nr:hypothetical protein [Candidatus Micrarchaeota archaeon]